MSDNLYKYKEMSRIMLVLCVIIGLIGFFITYKIVMSKYAITAKQELLEYFYKYISEVIYGVQ